MYERDEVGLDEVWSARNRIWGVCVEEKGDGLLVVTFLRMQTFPSKLAGDQSTK